MPYLQLDLNTALAADAKRALAAALARAYGSVMEADEQRISVSFRELGEGSVLRCFPDGPQPVTVVTCEIRAGREPERLARLAGEFCALAAQALAGTPEEVVVYFTQHPGWEIFRDGRVSEDWSPPR
jgi:phenylpyruvate tautomerase PptA (4-oxalocrotonate tautomerase family)